MALADFKIAIVDEQPVFRAGLKDLINNAEGLSVCWEASDSGQAVACVMEAYPDLLLIDVSLKEESGLELIKELKRGFPKLKIAVLSMCDENLYAERALRSGARGYIMKDANGDDIIKCIKKILGGSIYVSREMINKLFGELFLDKYEKVNSVDMLTDREFEIFSLIANGYRSKDIAAKLSISAKTVENHKTNIKEKLGIKNSVELAQRAVLWLAEQNRS